MPAPGWWRRRAAAAGRPGSPAGSPSAGWGWTAWSELSDDERRYALTHAARVLKPGGLLVIADEVVPRTGRQRRRQALVRAPLLALTYLASGAVTRPIADPAAEICAAGFTLAGEARSQGDAFALITAHRAAGEPQEQAP